MSDNGTPEPMLRSTHEEYLVLERQIHALDKRAISADSRLVSLIDDVEELKRSRPGVRFWLPLILTVTIAVVPGLWFLSTVPDRDDVAEMITERAPYVRERDRILTAIDTYERDARSIHATLQAISVQLSALAVRIEEQDRRVTEDRKAVIERVKRIEHKIDRSR